MGLNSQVFSMQIRILTQPITVELSSGKKAASATPTASTSSDSPTPVGDSKVTLSSMLSDTLHKWEQGMQQYRQAASRASSSIATSNRASRRQALAQRAQDLKDRVKAMQQMMSMADPATAKGLAMQLSRLAKELKSLAGELKSLSSGSSDGSGQQVNFSITQAGTDSASNAQSAGADSSASTSTVALDSSSVDTAVMPSSTDSSSVDTSVAITPANAATAGDTKADGQTPTTGSSSDALASAGEKKQDQDLATLLKELAGKLKAMRQMLKSLVEHSHEAKSLLAHAGDDLQDVDKALAQVDNNTSQALGSDGGPIADVGSGEVAISGDTAVSSG
jgi:hypothetical protein